MTTTNNRKKSVRFHVTYLEAPEVLERYSSNGNFLNFHNFCLRVGQSCNKENALEVQRQEKVELENDAREVTVDITCALKERWDKWLFPLMLQFEMSIPNDTPTHLVPSVTIPARKTLWNSLQTDHFDIRLHAIFWGNFLNRGLMMAHWEISYYTPTNHEDMVKQKFVQADFFHDESYAQFSFQTSERDNRNHQRSFCYYTLRMYYASIKKMIVDINGGDKTIKNKRGNGKVHRIHFVLSAPVLINKMTQKKKEELEKRGETKYGEGYRYTMIQRGRTFFEQPIDKSIFSESDTFTITFQEKNEQQLYEIISRIHFKSHCQVDFAPIQMVYGLLRKPSNSDDIAELQYVDIYAKENVGRVLNMLGYKSELKCINSKIDIFPFWYLLEGLLSRGAVVKDQILITETHYFNFLETVIHQWKNNKMRCEWALEELMDAIDQRKDIIPIIELFLKLLTAQKDAQEVMDRQHIKEGYIRCRKIIITPTRFIYVAPEVMMGNRVIRTRGTQEPNDPSMDKYKILRVSFRDDNNQRMTSTSTSKNLIEECVNKAMSNHGIFVGGLKFTYLGNSNSQMRDHGCYFFMGEMSESEYIRDVLGRFRALPNIAKVIARLGQCFTQSRESTIKLYRNRQRSHYDTVYDVIGGCDTAGEPYTYSDGVGQASKMFLATLAADLKLANRFIPSCIQFRFRGGKGVLTMDPVIDELIEFGSRLEFVDKETGVVTRTLFKDRNAPRFHRVIFRESQMKCLFGFDAPKNDDDSANMEVVKYSTPTPVALNKPFINILDQVSDMQSLATHEKVCGRIDTLLDRHLKMISMVLIDETMCRNRLKELPHRFDVDRLNPNFNLSSEPFFRSLVKACVRFSLHKQLHKEQIQIPHEYGRSMFGVFDETGLLQYGQIYCRYTVNLGLKNAPPSASARTLLGTVLVTKNPCIVSGDVRLFEAVDIPQLRHLRDVIVFPRHGPRPHPNEMAGSDLDGDEYSVIWDPELMFDYNMPPMDFTSVAGIHGISKDEMTAQMVAYYREYMTQDQVGKVANAHLMASDLFGLESQVANQIAKKCSEAVDFPKTGKAPDKLTIKWTQAYDPIKLQTVDTPPEKAFRVPDFMEKEHEPVYRSQRMTGKVYRRVKVVKDILHHSEERDSQLSFRLDPTINIINWEHYINEAREDYANYSADLKRVLDHYGIRTEAELLTGSILEMRNKLSDKDQDDMSFFNTTHMLEQQVNGIWTTYRQQFFEKINDTGDRFGDYNECTVLYEKHFVDEDNPLHRHCPIPTLEMKKKAVAYYKIAYEEARHTTSDEGRILSFPWIVWDVIRAVKADYLKDEDMFEGLEDRTFYSMMKANMDAYCKENRGDLNAFCNKLRRWHATNVYCQAYDGQGVWRHQELGQRVYDEPDQLGLSEMLFYVVRWGLKMKIFDSNFRELHLALIFIQYAIGEYPGIVFDQTVHITKVAMGLTNDGQTAPRIRQTLRSPARLLTMFLQFVGSSAFRHQKHLLFDDFGVYMGFYDNEWLGLSQSATLTFYSLVFSSRFEELPCVNQTEVPLPDFAKEEPSFTIEMPFRESDFEEELKKKCGLVDVKLRRKTGTTGSSFANRVRVSAMGTRGALRKLHKIVTPEPIHNAEALGQKCDNEYAWRTVRNIRSIQEVDEYDID